MNLKFSQILPFILVGGMLAALTGCNKSTTSNEVSEIDINGEIDASGTIGENTSVDVITETESAIPEVFSLKCKYWYDNPDVISRQQEMYDLAKNGTQTDEKYLNTFPVYTDASGSEYYISGRSFVYLYDTADNHNVYELRDQDTGLIHYLCLAGEPDNFLDEFDKVLLDSGSTQHTDYEYYSSSNNIPVLDRQKEYKIFMNNILMEDAYTPQEGYLPISNYLEKLNLGTYTIPDEETSSLGDNAYVLYLGTASGQIAITFSRDMTTGTTDIDYSSGEFISLYGTNEVYATSDKLLMAPTAIERLLGFHVEIYDSAINIITDNKDIATEASVLPL